MKLDKRYYWVVGGSVAIGLYLLDYLFINLLALKEPNLGILVLALPLVLPCNILGFKDNPYICVISSLIVYALVGALIGFLISKIKK